MFILMFPCVCTMTEVLFLMDIFILWLYIMCSVFVLLSGISDFLLICSDDDIYVQMILLYVYFTCLQWMASYFLVIVSKYFMYVLKFLTYECDYLWMTSSNWFNWLFLMLTYTFRMWWYFFTHGMLVIIFVL